MNEKILDAVKIISHKVSADPDVETEYYIHYQIIGTIGPMQFIIGRNENDKYMIGARKFDDAEEVLQEISHSEHIELVPWNAPVALQLSQIFASLEGKPQNAILYQRSFSSMKNPKEYFRVLIFKKIKKERQDILNEIMHVANKCAEETQRRWEHDSENW